MAPQTTLESMNFAVGETRLENTVRLACLNLGMHFKDGKITGNKEEYEIGKIEENEDVIGIGGHYRYDYSLFNRDSKEGRLGLIIESVSSASWNKFDETTSVENYTALYSDDILGREVFRILKERYDKN